MSCLVCGCRAFDSAQQKIEAIARGERGNIGDLLRILSWNRGLDVNMLRYEFEGYTVLHLAALSGNAAFIEGLLHRVKVDADAKSTHAAYTALHLSSWKGDLAIAKMFCERALVDLEIKSREGFTALHYAAWAGSVELCFYLVSVGARLKVKNKHGYTPLLVAARAGNEDVVHYLVGQGGVDIDEADNDGCSGLHHACYEGHQKVVTILLKNEANSTLRDKLDRTPKDLCKSRDLADIISSIYVPSAGEKKRTTFKLKVAVPPTTISARAGQEAGEYANSRGGGGSKYKVEHLGENYLSSLPDPPSPSTLTLQQKRKGGPAKNVTNAAGAGAGGGDAEEKEEQTRGYLLPAGTTSGVGLHVAPKVAQECWRLCSQNGDAAALRRLLTAYSALTHGRPSPLYYLRDSDNWTLCMRAASKGYLEVVKVLLSIDTSAASLSCDHGWNALHRAAAAGHLAVVELLLSLVEAEGTPAVQVDAKTGRGATALMKAAEFGHVDVCKALVLKGADENERDKEGFTALHLAALYAHRDVVILLVSECQANPLAMTVEGDLAEDFTRSKHIKNLLRAVQFHHSKSASFPVPITQAQEGELAQAWKAVEICIEQLRKHQGSPAKGADRIPKGKRADGTGGTSGTATTPGSSSNSSSPHRDQFRTPGQRSVTRRESSAADASKSAWEMIRSARSKGKGQNSITSPSPAQAGFSKQRLRVATSSPTSTLGSPASAGAESPRSPLTISSSPTSAAGTSPDNHMMSLRERLKAKYKMIDEKQEAARHHLDGGDSSEAGDKQGDEDEDSDDDVGLPLIPHDEGRADLKDSTGKTVFKKVPMEDVDAVVAMQIAEDVMKDKDNDEGGTSNSAAAAGSALEAASRKGMKGSLLLTIILTQVYTVYANKINRAFYRWKHRTTIKPKTEPTSKSLSPAREQQKEK